jgi:hypothetical protein
MTETDLFSLPAGPALDQLVLEYVFRATVYKSWDDFCERRFEKKEGTPFPAVYPFGRDKLRCWVFWDGASGNAVLFEPSKDIRHAWQMEERLEQDGLALPYSNVIIEVVGRTAAVEVGRTTYEVNSWDLLHASPEQRCRAALITMWRRQEALGVGLNPDPTQVDFSTVERPFSLFAEMWRQEFEKPAPPRQP